MIRNKVLFKVSTDLYSKYAPFVPAQVFEQIDGEWGLKILPIIDQLSTTQALDPFGNAVIDDYSSRDGQLHTYTFDLKYNLYAYYKILQELQETAVDGSGNPIQVEMVDFIDPKSSDLTIPSGGIDQIPYRTTRRGVIANLELSGATSYQFTNQYYSPNSEFLRTYRCLGTRFTFEERGVPLPLILTAPAGTMTIYPLRDELEQTYEGNDERKYGYSDVFVRVEVKKRIISVDSGLNDRTIFDNLYNLQQSCVLGTGEFSAATMQYDGETITGVIRDLRRKKAVYTRVNRDTLLSESTIGGFSFKFQEL